MACAAPVSHTLVYNTSLSTPQPGAKMASIPVHILPFLFYSVRTSSDKTCVSGITVAYFYNVPGCPSLCTTEDW